MLKASTDALSALARATSERTIVACFDSSEMRDTPEAVAFRHAHARKLMAAAGLDVSPTGTLSLLAATAAASTPANGADVPAEGGATPSTPALTSTSTPRMPPEQAPAPAPAAGAALVPASPPAAGSTGPEPPARAVMETAASTSAPPASADGSGAASRGRRSLVTKQAKAAAALASASKTLDDENDGFLWCLSLPRAIMARAIPRTKTKLRGMTLVMTRPTLNTNSVWSVYRAALSKVFFPRWAGVLFLLLLSLRATVASL